MPYWSNTMQLNNNQLEDGKLEQVTRSTKQNSSTNIKVN